MERYIGWILGRLNARRLAAASLFRNALSIESYKSQFQIPFNEGASLFLNECGEGGHRLLGTGYKRSLNENLNPESLSGDDERLLNLLRSYLKRKYDGMKVREAELALATVSHCMF